jgi:hypothetical protein
VNTDKTLGDIVRAVGDAMMALGFKQDAVSMLPQDVDVLPFGNVRFSIHLTACCNPVEDAETNAKWRQLPDDNRINDEREYQEACKQQEGKR